MTPENKEQITNIIKTHYEKFDVLKVEGYDIVKKAQLMYNELPTIYKQLDEAKVLPENIDFNKFMHIVVPRLEEAAQHAHVAMMFGI
jgi:hypothetical protein